MTSSNVELAEQADRHLWGHFSSLGRSIDGMPIIERGEGAELIDIEGNRYLDGVSSLWVNVHGHSHPRIVERLRV